MTRILPSLDPRFVREVIYTNVVEPCIEEILPSDDKQTIGCYGRQMRIPSAGHIRIVG
jgi:hypothetical protein